jgi:hypothetical protein
MGLKAIRVQTVVMGFFVLRVKFFLPKQMCIHEMFSWVFNFFVCHEKKSFGSA